MATDQPCQWGKSGQALGGIRLRSLVAYSHYRALLCSGLAGSWAIVSLTTATVSQAQQTVPLPPPPTVSVPGLAAPLTNSTPLPGGETVFLAPVNRQGTTIGQYTVHVNGDSPYLLQQVRSIEPTASVQRYQGQAVIQAGTFDNEASARRQIAALNAQGLMAELATTNAPVNATPPTATTSRYVVIVPGSQSELARLTDRAVRMGIRQEAIQEKSAPLGPHLEIGPFAQQSDAKKISQFLNGGGLDSLVYYSR